MLLMLPSDPLNSKRVDEHFTPERDAARDSGVPFAYFDHDAALQPDGATQAVARIPDGSEVVYRGWMLPVEAYRRVEQALTAKGSSFITSSSQYDRAHRMPLWYPLLEDVTPQTVWSTGVSLDVLQTRVALLPPGPGVLRDWSKSMKHYWDEACFIPDVHDPSEVSRVASRFLELRDTDFDTGFVARQFEQFEPGEWRSWWVSGECLTVTPHPDNPNLPVPDDLDASAFSSLVSVTELPFVSLDLTRRVDGVWRVVELGDGQVSDWPEGLDVAPLVEALSRLTSEQARSQTPRRAQVPRPPAAGSGFGPGE